MWNLFTTTPNANGNGGGGGFQNQTDVSLVPAAKRVRLENGYGTPMMQNNNNANGFQGLGMPFGGSNMMFSAPMDATTMMALAGQRQMANAAAEEAARLENRRKKNALLAKKSRERKKNLEVSLAIEMRELQEENDHLKSIVKTHCAENAQDIIGECCYKPRGKGFHGAQSSKLSRSDFDLIESLTASRQSFVLTDPRLPDNPIVYASCSFLKLTGYTRDQVVGRNCRFLQGKDTEDEAVNTMRDAVQKGSDGACCLLNYKADGTPFWNNIFIAALRDKEQRIVNYVGVQCEVEKPSSSADENASETQTASGQMDNNNGEIQNTGEMAMDQQPLPLNNNNNSAPPDITKLNRALEPVSLANDPLLTGHLEDDEAEIDWSHLASVLEADYEEEWATEWDKERADSTPQDECILQQFFESPREFVIRTVRSELIDSLLNSNGDVTNPRFVSALDVLSNIYKSTYHDNCSLSTILHGSWKSISRPSYHNAGCLGMNDRNEYVYTLGKMAFNMFKPGNLRCTVQDTMNNILPVCEMGAAPTHAPWSLRRELALTETNSSLPSPNTMLKSYDIAVAITIEPGQFGAQEGEEIPSPSCRLRGLQIVHGYFLPDPDTPNRLTVWFTGGKLSPAPPPEGKGQNFSKPEDSYGGFEEWKQLFGAEHKRTWTESLSVMGAKLFLGAEVNNEMEPDGTMSYTLHRPYGGHGKGYADVMYVDDEVLITKGNYGTVHVMTKNSTQSPSTVSTTPAVATTFAPIDNNNKVASSLQPMESSESLGVVSKMPVDSDALFDLSSTLSVPSFFHKNHFPDAIESTEKVLAAAQQFISAARS